jgi:group I intron endonuclease
MSSGCYALISPSGRWYIGSSHNTKKRWIQHRWQLEGGFHSNSHLQRAWNKHKSFEFVKLLGCEIEELVEYEQPLLDLLKPEYNIVKLAGQYYAGWKLREETVRRMSKSLRGKIRSEKTRARMSEAALERFSGEKACKQISESKKKWWAGTEGKENGKKLSELFKARGGVASSPEQRRKAAEARIGSSWSEERKAAHKLKWELFGKRPHRSKTHRTAEKAGCTAD